MLDLALPLVLGAGAAILVAVVVQERRRVRRWRTWPRAEGVIEERRGVPARDHSFRVRVRFTTAQGQEVLGWSTNAIGIEAAPTVGSSVVVVHDPEDAARFEARPATPGEPTHWGWWVLAAGIVGFVALILWASWG